MKLLIRDLLATGVLRSPAIIAAFRAIDRKDFVRPEYLTEAYLDTALPIGFEQTISQPTTVAYMLELLDAKPGDRILDVGSGSGWTTALLAHIAGTAGEVFGVERIPELVDFGSTNLIKYSFPRAHLTHADTTLGLPEKSPFDRILVSAASPELPLELVAQLALGGTLVIPIGTSLIKIQKNRDGDITSSEHPGFVFVPLIP
ncbi:MAG: protein-L-isoaspartate O-methyltransferase [Candidatus Yonathbacteria bacterium RIFOXYC1_FULL_52_10]|uniref:Protein-L-isoaspartate O-methyltransferase n=1 Tax=Candidatus Yonathbacteria bacterium RIFOXYD1_FULL_52_36 TaxID=1802730 RepID=A0A1G2SHU3_9BACT|nr:MAG: protein-L-isoaspartate O-methyltransferase [Candidatus Yonathbacteria bacterium RIFOXYD1_FULL_52_36]OHA85004.1 MAG: protein-L-isoaspartate O-methyltransferase [Candidatus Yonathbacteria bacterium RIFOXYC1_FULL_52_10]